MSLGPPHVTDVPLRATIIRGLESSQVKAPPQRPSSTQHNLASHQPTPHTSPAAWFHALPDAQRGHVHVPRSHHHHHHHPPILATVACTDLSPPPIDAATISGNDSGRLVALSLSPSSVCPPSTLPAHANLPLPPLPLLLLLLLLLPQSPPPPPPHHHHPFAAVCRVPPPPRMYVVYHHHYPPTNSSTEWPAHRRTRFLCLPG